MKIITIIQSINKSGAPVVNTTYFTSIEEGRASFASLVDGVGDDAGVTLFDFLVGRSSMSSTTEALRLVVVAVAAAAAGLDSGRIVVIISGTMSTGLASCGSSIATIESSDAKCTRLSKLPSA